MDIYTIGYGGRGPGDFVELLTSRGIRTVCDVRLRPDRASMGSYMMAKSPDKGIVALLDGAGIAHRSFIELGNVFLDFEDWRERYARLLASAGDLLSERLRQMEPPFALLCAEKRPADCHRSILADYLGRTYGYRLVEHVVD
jgi:uncharacterized protein (DUF488 family)